ncbi:hypothetical protein RDI58_015508 [Solanum bulbocastanum]|uniref:Uncharacterized protein n=1 Tax=Solanum bulbocastanum TaxID=147425 RepID=A0AAN8TLP7_SOLBU
MLEEIRIKVMTRLAENEKKLGIGKLNTVQNA